MIMHKRKGSNPSAFCGAEIGDWRELAVHWSAVTCKECTRHRFLKVPSLSMRRAEENLVIEKITQLWTELGVEIQRLSGRKYLK